MPTNGLSLGISAVGSVLIRKILPNKLFKFCALLLGSLPFPPSPVAMYSLRSGPKPSHPALWLLSLGWSISSKMVSDVGSALLTLLLTLKRAIRERWGV